MRTHLFMILCLYKMCVCVVTDAVRLCTLQSIVFPKLIILFTITKLLLPLDANTLQHGSGVNCVNDPLLVVFCWFWFFFEIVFSRVLALDSLS